MRKIPSHTQTKGIVCRLLALNASIVKSSIDKFELILCLEPIGIVFRGGHHRVCYGNLLTCGAFQTTSEINLASSVL